MALKCFEIDQSLPQHVIWNRVNGYKHWKGVFQDNEGGILKFADGYKTFGMNRNADDTGFIFREYLPGAKQVFLIGQFNNWENTTPLKDEGFGRWMVELPDVAPGEYMVPHKTKYKIRLESHNGGWYDRVPAWAKLAWQEGNGAFDATMWEPPTEEQYKFKHPNPSKPVGLKVYESHVGMSSPECKINTYLDFADYVLPRIKKLGYNAIQLMAVAEHAYYGCFGYHVTSFFAPSSRFGTPDELKYLVDRAHGMGIQVLVDLVHAHCSSNANDGIAMLDGTDHCYTHGGALGYHSQWDSRLFNYESYETLRFLLSNVKYWLTEFRFDGFRFDGVSSMLYKSHAINVDVHDYFGPDADVAGHIYLMLANDVIKSTLPSATTIAEDVSGMPTLALPIEWGGFGFDARLAMAIPDMWIKILKEGTPDEAWSMKWIAGELQNRRPCERAIAYAESHDQAIVGDKTIAFWLMDAEMYTGMSLVQCPFPSPCVERGLALHKMIRMVCLALGEGYLNFHGNEFGHPEWVDFPREGNGWSLHHANRRYDLPDADHLRYQFFNNFDMYMHQVENRFKFLSDWHYHCTLVSEEDKVIAVERGECLIVFNFHPCNSYTDYRIGTKWNEPMRTIMDSDEGRFGGQSRLEWGHGNSFPVGDGWMSRNHSIKMYLPSRTVQVLVLEQHLQGGVYIQIDPSFIANRSEISKISDLTLILLKEEWTDGKRSMKEDGEFKFDGSSTLHLSEMLEAHFRLQASDGVEVGCAADFDGIYHCYFPGTYVITGIGCVEALSPWETEQIKSVQPQTAEKVHEGESAETEQIESDPTQTAEKVHEDESAAVDCKSGSGGNAALGAKDESVAADSKSGYGGNAALGAKEAAQTDAVVAVEVEQSAAEGCTPKEVQQDEQSVQACQLLTEEQKQVQQIATQEATQEAAANAEEMTRWPSMHFLGALDALEGNQEVMCPAKACEHINLTGEEPVNLSLSYKSFGLHRMGDRWVFREWLPKVESASLVGEFNHWNIDATPLEKEETMEDVWTCTIKSPQADAIKKGQKYKVYVKSVDGKCSWLTPAWATKMTFTPDVKVLDAVVWPVEPVALASVSQPATANELVYECHLGLASRPGQPKSFAEAAEVVIPRAVRNGYTALLLIGVQECKNYSEMGAQPCVYFAPASCLGEPEDLQQFVSKAHRAGLRVYMSIAHDGAARCSDGLPDHYFRAGTDQVDPVTGVRIFDYESKEVVRYLLSSLSFWMAEYGFDGFLFPNVTSMIYTSRGRWLPIEVSELDEYVKKPGTLDESAMQYLKLANACVHERGQLLNRRATTIAADSSMHPDVTRPIENGGVGFDMRHSNHAADALRQAFKQTDEDWSMSDLVERLSFPRNVRPGSGVLTSSESFRECVASRKPLKIAFLAWETLHTIAVGGVAPHVTELGAALHGAGHEVHIFTRAQGNAMDHTIMGVHYHEVNYDKHGCMVQDIRNMCGAFVHALHGHESVWGTFDIIHGHDWLAGPAIQQLKCEGRRVVFTMHSTEGGRNGDMGKGHPGIKEVERGGCGAADKLICVSGVLKDEVKNCCGGAECKMTVIYNGIQAGPIVNMEWCDEWSGNTKMDKGWNPMDPMFLFVGRHTAQKGCDIFIEAIPMILQCRGDAKFVIVGDGHLKAHNEGRAHALGVMHAVCFTGSLKSGSAHLKALFRSCDAVVVPSRNEPFGIVVLEAWASGKPVVATTSGGPRDFVKPGEDGYLVDPSPNSVAWGCCQILSNFEHAKWMGRNAQAKAMREFSWEHIAHETEQVYNELLNLHDLPKVNSRDAGYSLARKLLQDSCFQMQAVNADPLVARGLSLLRVTKLLVSSLGGTSVMTWMGTEFAQIDPVDMPRPGNGFNDELSRIKYELADNSDLKFSQMESFEQHLNQSARKHGWLADPKHQMVSLCEKDKIIAFTRGRCLFVFNLHPSNHLDGYSLQVPQAVRTGSLLECVLDTNDTRFGGSHRSTVAPTETSKTGALKVNLPSRTAAVFAPSDTAIGG